MPTLRPLAGVPNQFEKDVEEYVHVNGATCLVTIDVTNLGSTFARREVQAGRPGPNDAQLGDMLEAEIRSKIQACPQGENAKLQIMYHATSKPIDAGGGANRNWQQQNSIEHALQKIARSPEPRFKKLVLSGCHSQENDRHLVDAAFDIPSVEKVLTFKEIIFLTPGSVSGADLGYNERPLTIYVWEKDDEGRQIACKPDAQIEADEHLDLSTLYVEDKTAPATSRCPTQHLRSGSDSRKLGSYKSTAAAGAAIVTMSRPIIKYSYSYAYADAVADHDQFQCPNQSCQMKTLSAVRVTGETWSIRTSIARSVLSFITFGAVNQWNVFVRYTWSAQLTCT